MADVKTINLNNTSYNIRDDSKIPSSEKGANNGVATLDASGKVPSSQLPAYVDDVLEYSSTSAFPQEGSTGIIYVATDTNKSYRWSGSGYIELSSYSEATPSASGLMSAADKEKLTSLNYDALSIVNGQLCITYTRED